MSDWSKPREVSNLDMAFPVGAMELMPAHKDIPEQFDNSEKWDRFISDWFFCGLKGYELTPREGIDTEKALRHIKAIIGSFEPKHEHKQVGCAYLMSLWFADGKWERNEPSWMKEAKEQLERAAAARKP